MTILYRVNGGPCIEGKLDGTCENNILDMNGNVVVGAVRCLPRDCPDEVVVVNQTTQPLPLDTDCNGKEAVTVHDACAVAAINNTKDELKAVLVDILSVLQAMASELPEVMVGSTIIELLPDNSETPPIFVELGLDPSKEYSITTSAYAGVIDINRAIGSSGVEVVASNNTGATLVQTSIAVKAVEIL